MITEGEQDEGELWTVCRVWVILRGEKQECKNGVYTWEGGVTVVYIDPRRMIQGLPHPARTTRLIETPGRALNVSIIVLPVHQLVKESPQIAPPCPLADRSNIKVSAGPQAARLFPLGSPKWLSMR